MVLVNRISLYIADADALFITSVISALSHSERIRIVGFSRDGSTALSQIKALRPNILLTDVQLPVLDGIELMRLANRLKHPPLCIACTRFYSDAVLDAAQSNGAFYCLYKPIHFNGLPSVIDNCWDTRMRARKAAEPTGGRNDPNLAHASRARAMLVELGFPMRVSGTLYLLEAMLRLQSDPMLLKNLSKGLYADLAEALHSTPVAVERSLRGAIAAAWACGSLSGVFPGKPTNRCFIEYLQRRLTEEGQ